MPKKNSLEYGKTMPTFGVELDDAWSSPFGEAEVRTAAKAAAIVAPEPVEEASESVAASEPKADATTVQLQTSIDALREEVYTLRMQQDRQSKTLCILLCIISALLFNYLDRLRMHSRLMRSPSA